MKTVLKVEGLTKVIKGKTLVDHISFDVMEGEVFGFLGPNGAGKTTTIRMLVGLISPTSGAISIADQDIKVHFKQAMKHVGCIVENPELYGYLSGWENLIQFSRMIGLKDEKRVDEIVKLVNLDERIHDKVKTYSLGMKQRLGIAQALLSDPKLLILDEPTNGLDPAGIRELREFIHMLVKKQNMSVFISSHLLSEIEMICDRVGIIHKGKMLRVSTVKDLVNEETERVEWHVTPLQETVKLLEAFSFIKDVTIENKVVMCKMPKDQIHVVTKHLVEQGIEMNGVKINPVTLEDLFMEITGGAEVG
ncbi:ABC transporter ATP-binding protein [Bacillus sp. DJP31]|uniref:ABC transporter ATP-binding protein n=1 Tax=Bacillus sp. DJP31 TaxID=3409789 RepID=UPI003BB54A5B